MSSPDHLLAAAALQRVFESLPDLYLVLAPDWTIVAVSEAYAQAAMTPREALVGHGLFEVFPDNPQDPTAAGVTQLRASLEWVLAEGVPHTIPVHKYDIPQRGRQTGAFVERYWSVLNTLVFDAQHEIAYLLHRVEDITEFIQLRQHKQASQVVTAELQTRLGQIEAEIYRRAQEVQEARVNALQVLGKPRSWAR